MKRNKFNIMLGIAIALGLSFGVAAHADEADQATIITFSAPVEIPGQVLPAGKYLFKLAGNGSDPNFVQIFNADGTRLYATLSTIPTELQEPLDHTAVTLAEQGTGTPDALVKWFYPGSVTGHQFMYSSHEEKQLAQDRQQTIVANTGTTNSEVQAGD